MIVEQRSVWVVWLTNEIFLLWATKLDAQRSAERAKLDGMNPRIEQRALYTHTGE